MDCGESTPVAGRFLKVLKPGFETALKLPAAFSRMLNNTDPNSKRALLKSCRGSWTVEIKKCDHGCLHFLGKTWEVYVSEHNLKEGDFIVFKHKSRLRFKTVMFDETGCEKDFATSEDEEEEEEESSSKECFDEHMDEKDEGQDIHDEDDVPIEGNYGSTADQTASFSRFQITLTKWTIRHGTMMVPKIFAISNDMVQNKTVKLRNGTGDSWLAKLQVRNSMEANTPPRKRVAFKGLIKFLRENKLKIGDKCTFKLAQHSRSSEDRHVVMDVVFEHKGRLHFNTHMFNEMGCERDFVTSEEDEEEVECFEHVQQTPKSQFQQTLTRWNFTHHSLTVPMSFARSNDMMRNTSVKLQDGTGDSWLVRLIVSIIERAHKSVERRVSLSISAEFLRDNDLKVGDTCIFKLVQPSTRQEHVVMDVAFVRGR